MAFDPTAFARVGAVDTAPRTGLAMIGAAQAGAQEGRAKQLHQIVMGEEERQSRLREMGEKVSLAYRSNDVNGYQRRLAEMAAVDPSAAAELGGLLGSMDKTNRVEASHYLYGAATMTDSIEDQNSMLRKATEVLGPDDPFTPMLSKLMNMPLGDERNAELFGAIEMAKSLGYLPSEKDGKIEVEREKARTKAASDVRRALDTQLADFRATRRAYGRIESAAKRKGPASSLAMVFNYMKMLDPGSVVRESEFQTAAQAKAWIDKVDNGSIKVNPEATPGVAWVRRLAMGEVLNEKQKQDFLDMSNALMRKAQSDADVITDEMLQRAEQEEVSGERLLGKKRYAEWRQRVGTPNITTQEEYDKLPSGAEYMEDGVRYRKP